MTVIVLEEQKQHPKEVGGSQRLHFPHIQADYSLASLWVPLVYPSFISKPGHKSSGHGYNSSHSHSCTILQKRLRKQLPPTTSEAALSKVPVTFYPSKLKSLMLSLIWRYLWTSFKFSSFQPTHEFRKLPLEIQLDKLTRTRTSNLHLPMHRLTHTT